MKTVLKALTLAAIAVFALVQQSKAQSKVVTPTFAITNAVTQTLQTLGTVPEAIDCGSQRNVAIKWTTVLGGAGTELIGLRFVPSIDGTLPSTPDATASTFRMVIAANGTTPVIVQTNFDTLGYRYLLPYYLTNGNATYYSTNTIEYLVKKNAP